MVLNCICLIISDVVHLFMYLRAFVRLLWETVRSGLLSILIGKTLGRFFCYWVVWGPYIFWVLTPTWYAICKCFLPFLRLTLDFVDVFVQKCFSSMQSLLFIFTFVACGVGVTFKELFPRWVSRRFPPMFSSRIFIVSGLIFKFLI